MALIVKMEEGAKTPNLYTYDGKLYDFDELQRRANLEVQNYISQIRRGNKHQDELLDAYNNLLEGIRNGTITYNNGRYIDSTGTYRNSKRKRNDWYGLMANHINTIQRGMNEYLKPEPTVETTPAPVQESELKVEQPVVLQEVSKQEELPVRPKTREELFTDWVAINHPRGNIQYTPSSLTVNDNILKDSDDFYNLIISGAPALSLISLLMLGVDEGLELKYDKKFYDINNNPTNISNNYFYNKILNQLYNNNQLKELIKGVAYYIPGTEKDESVLVWNKKDNELGRMSMHDIPDYQYKYLLEYNEANNGILGLPKPGYENYRKYFVTSEKNGGILKAEDGIKFNTLEEALNWKDEDLTDDKRLRNIFDNGKYSLANRNDLKSTDNIIKGNGFYDPELGDNLEDLNYYKSFINKLTSNPKLAEAWARRYKTLLGINKNVYASWFDKDDKFNFENFKSGDKHVWNDRVNGVGHDIYRGRVYKIDGEDGYYSDLLDGYELVGNSTLSEDGLANIYTIRKKESTPELSANPIKLEQISESTPIVGTGSASETGLNKEDKPGTGKQSHINPTELGTKPNDFTDYKKSYDWISPEAIALGRVFASKRFNKKIADTLIKSLAPSLRSTYELYSPITGDFNKKQAKYKQAADMRFEGSNADVSDYNQILKKQYGFNLAGMKLEDEGNILYDDGIERTRVEAMKRAEDNMKRRSDDKNFNDAELNRIQQQKALIEASRQKMDFESTDTYAKDVQSRLRTLYDKNKLDRQNFALQTGLSNVEQQYKDIMSDPTTKFNSYYSNYKASEHNNVPIELTDFYKNFIKFRDEMANWKTANDYGVYSNVRGYGYKNPYLNKTALNIRNSYTFLKQGGILSKQEIDNINKMIRNESNS